MDETKTLDEAVHDLWVEVSRPLVPVVERLNDRVGRSPRLMRAIDSRTGRALGAPAEWVRRWFAYCFGPPRV